MRKMLSIRRFTLGLCLVAIPVALHACGGGAERASSTIDAAHIVQVKIGMTVPEVVEILGHPFTIEPKPMELYGEHAVLMTYTRPVETAWWYPMLWVHLKNGRVVEVYGKRYEGFDDRGVYVLNLERQWQSDDFEATFAAEIP